MKNNLSKLIIVLFFSFFAMSFFLSGPTAVQPVQADLVGKVASDGTRVVVKYFHPYITVRNNTGDSIKGWWFEVPEGYLIEYPDMQVIMLFAGPSYQTFNYTVEYFHMTWNATSEEYIYDKYETLNKSISALGNSEVKDEFELPNIQEKIHVVISYENIFYQFNYQLAELVIEREYSLFELKFNNLLTFLLVFASLVVGCGAIAYGLVKKAGRFDLDYTWAFLIPSIAADIWLIIAEMNFDGSYKEAFYALPSWVIYGTFAISSTIVWIYILNRIIGIHYVSVAVYDTETMEHDSHDVPVDKDHKFLLEPGFRAAIIRLFSRRKTFIRFRKGSFREITIPQKVIVKSSDDIGEKIEMMRNLGYTPVGQLPNVDGTITLNFTKQELDFDEKALCPQWPWRKRGTSVADQYWCKHKVYTQTTFQPKMKFWVPAGLLTVANMFFTVFWRPADIYGPIFKGVLWFVIGLGILLIFKYSAVPGRYDIEVLDMHVAKSIVEAQYITAKAKKDAEAILLLKDRIIELENRMKHETLDNGYKIAKGFIRGMEGRISWEENKEHKEEEEEDAD